MYLVDTNVWLERLLDQARSEEVGHFLERLSPELLFITDFSFHSIGVVLDRLEQTDVLIHFVQDVFLDGGVSLIHREREDTTQDGQILVTCEFCSNSYAFDVGEIEPA